MPWVSRGVSLQQDVQEVCLQRLGPARCSAGWPGTALGCEQGAEEGEAGSGGRELEAHQTTAGGWPGVWDRVGPELLFHMRE